MIDKTDLRAAARKRRANAPAAVIAPETLRFPSGTIIAGYWPIGGEIDPRPLLRALAQGGCMLALPVVTGPDRALDFRLWDQSIPLEDGPHRTRQPSASAPLIRPDVVLVPLLAFDRSGNRLGQGGGYYDRTLAALRADGPVLAIGAAHTFQEVDAVPADRHDQRLDRIITEKGPFVPPTT